jgi:hypothetical protein
MSARRRCQSIRRLLHCFSTFRLEFP